MTGTLLIYAPVPLIKVDGELHLRRSASDGAPFSDVDVFRHRSDLIKKHLAPALKQSTRADLEWA